MAYLTRGGAPNFAAELIRQREASGLNKYRLSAQAGIDASLLSRFESGRRVPSLPMAVKLAAALGADEAARCRLVLSAGFLPPGYVVTGLRKERGG